MSEQEMTNETHEFQQYKNTGYCGFAISRVPGHRCGQIRLASVHGSEGAEKREFDHFSIVPFKAICGADISNQSTTQTPERAKCATCCQYWKEFESSRRLSQGGPHVGITRADGLSELLPPTEAHSAPEATLVPHKKINLLTTLEHQIFRNHPYSETCSECKITAQIANCLRNELGLKGENQ